MSDKHGALHTRLSGLLSHQEYTGNQKILVREVHESATEFRTDRIDQQNRVLCAIVSHGIVLTRLKQFVLPAYDPP